MTIQAAISSASNPAAAVRELRAALGKANPAFVVFFASSVHDPEALGRAIAESFAGVPSIGCTTAGEIGAGRMLERSISLLAFGADDLRSIHVASAPDIGAEASVNGALRSLSSSIGAGVATLDPARYVGLVLQDGMSGAEESVMATLSSATNMPFIGGSAGDDAKFKTTWVFVNGKPLTRAVALAVLEPSRPFAILKTQSFDVLDQTLKVTDVDEATRTVRGFNGKPAAEEYARVLGTTVAELPKYFMSRPVGLVLPNGEPFVRSPQQLRGNDVVFYCQVKEGMLLKVLAARNIVEDTRRDLEDGVRNLGTCSAILNFHCILRTLELQEKKQCEAYGALFSKIPTAGFSTYGESYIGHINQTSTMVLFG